MPVELEEPSGGRILEVRATRKLAASDYVQLVPEFERLKKQHGKLRAPFALMLGATLTLTWAGVPAVAGGESDAEKQARIEQFDKGPATIDVSKYPDKLQDYYQAFSRKCSQCHRLSRPVNSDYVLPDQWSRYIKRMMYKPGSNISRSDAKKIYDFLVYDSSVRKKKALDKTLQTLAPDERRKAEDAIKEVVDKYK